MATVILSTIGSAVGSAFGPVGSMIGRAGGAFIGSHIDDALFAPDAPDMVGPRLGGVRMATAEEGLPIPRVYGTVRCGGQLIWATRFEEVTTTREREGGSSTGGGGGSTTTYSYFGNAAYALCEGPISHVRRVWADGRELDLADVGMRVHRGTDDQPPDPLIEAKQGGGAPAYRGTAYVVFERLPLAGHGNRLPQFSFEVVRAVNSVARDLRAVTIIPGATEHGYDPRPVVEEIEEGESVALNRHVRHASSDWAASIDELQALCPDLEAVSLVVSWFGDDLDCARCAVRPGVETPVRPAVSRRWNVAGMRRSGARLVSRLVSRHGSGPAFGGTPDDASVTDAITDLKRRGLKVFLYPFVLMDVPPGNALADPYGAPEQAAFPWRGRITVSPAPGREGSPDGTTAADAAVASFLSSYEPFIAHYARLCAAAGGVDGFVIGSEMRGLTWVRGATGHPFVDGLRRIAAATKAALPDAAVTYAADWTEWFGHQPPGEPGTLLYHLDPLWADPAIDAVGIDCYVPLSDVRDGDELDGGPDGIASALDVAGLAANIEGGEGFDWFYASPDDRAARRRTPITDGAHGKPWVWRSKDVRSWWSNPHVERRDGVETGGPTEWVPRSKPIWLTELGAPAVDRAANQPNVFPDPKSSEDAAPHHSSGARDDAAQHALLRAHLDHWTGSDDGPVDPARTFLWTWDARPAPAFPVRADVWSDGANWARGHWLNGRLNGAPVAEIVAAILLDHGFERFDVSGVSGFATGLLLDDPATARRSLDAVLDAHGIGVSERDGTLCFRSLDRPTVPARSIDVLAAGQGEVDATRRRGREIDVPDEIALAHRDPMRDHGVATTLVREPGAGTRRGALATPLVLEREVASSVAARLLHRSRDRVESAELAVPWSHADLRAGDTVTGPAEAPGRWLVEGIEDGSMRRLSLRAAPARTAPPAATGEAPRPTVPDVPAGRPRAVALDLPLLPGHEGEGGAAMAAWTRPWRPLAVLTRDADARLRPRAPIDAPATIGRLLDDLPPGPVGPFDRATTLRLRCPAGVFAPASERAVLDGANALAVRCATGWEVLQFARADEVAPGVWCLSQLLRGRLGTEGAMRSGAGAGADAVLLDGAVAPLALDPSERGERLRWRVGPVDALDPDRFREVDASLGARAVTPLSPVHLAVADGTLRWVRRSRSDADRWDGEDIGLGEERERYRVRLFASDGATRTVETDRPELVLPTDMPRPVTASVAQLGAREGDATTIAVR